MSSWVPLRTAVPEPLCVPSTSYAVPGISGCISGLRERRWGGQLNRGRAFRRIRCRASQAAHSHHNAYKILHQSSQPTELSTASDAAQQPRQKTRSRSQPKFVRPDTSLPPPPSPPSPPGFKVSEPLLVPTNASHVVDCAVPSSTLPYLPNTTFASPFQNGVVSISNSPIDTVSSESIAISASTSPQHGFNPEMEDLRPYIPHSVSLPHWQPPPTSLQHRTALTRAISQCPTYTRLHQLILDNAADFNCYHTCAALSRVLVLHTEGLTPRESRLFKEGCSTLQAILRRQVPELQPRALVVAAYSLARLELPDRELLAGLAAAVEPHLSTLQPQGLSSLLWAFARQNHQPPPKWMDSMLSACTADLGAFAPRDMATVIWALARLHYKVAPARLKQLLEHTQVNIDSFSGRSLSNVVYALALSQQHPGGEWLTAAQARAVALGPGDFSPQGITQMAWGIAKLGAAPTPAFVDLLLEHASQRLPPAPHERLRRRDQEQQVQQQREGGNGMEGKPERRLGRYSGLDLATLMFALASLGAQPRADLGRRLLAAVQWELPSLEANGMCNCLWACARLRIYPTKMWLSCFFDASYRQLPYFKPVDLSQTLWALARLQASPPSAWMTSVMNRLQLSASMFSPVEVATTMWALARLGMRGEQMPGEVLALFFIATDRRLSSFKPQELSSMIWALAHMRRRPDKEWIAEFLKVTYHRLASMNGWCLATLAWSLAELSLLPPPAWIYNYVNAARTLMNAAPASRSPVGVGGGDCGTGAAVAGRRSAGAAAADRDESQLSAGLTAMDLGQIITSLRRLNGSSSTSTSGGLAKVDEFLGEAEQRLAAMEVGSGAYARQQLGAFLAMSPEQAGLTVMVPSMVPEHHGYIEDDVNGANVVAASAGASTMGGSAPGAVTAAAVVATTGTEVPRQNRRRARKGPGALGEKRAGQGGAAMAGKRAAAATGRNGRGTAPFLSGHSKYNTSVAVPLGVPNGTSSGGDSELNAAAAATAVVTASTVAATAAVTASASRGITRLLSGATRMTLAAHADVHVDLGGDVNVGLSASPSGPSVMWRPAVAVSGTPPGIVGGGGLSTNGETNGNGNGHGSNCAGGNGDMSGAATGGEDISVNTAEIKRRLLAV
ncbi:hypothetical protein VaNZ11_009729 [Volvox africanus]|uniref:Tbc2 translation factor, chloroplastic n=1 Tax=Volvox africanus TaxID=51714 RepID=A0ABQ5S8P3_9CHLO|nr:hypothetical protein VaNZ11_009729 [Volvox africanus]